jgi:hypothetical protein
MSDQSAAIKFLDIAVCTAETKVFRTARAAGRIAAMLIVNSAEDKAEEATRISEHLSTIER